jgi:hypothetical protein
MLTHGRRSSVASIAVATALVAAPLLHAQTGRQLQRNDFVVAGIPLQADSGTVRRLLGRPDSITKGDDPSEASGELLAWWYPDLEIVFLSDGTVLGEWIRGASRSTARGLRVGAARDAVLQLYGRPNPSAADSTMVYVLRHREGTPRLLIYTSAGRVSAIYAGRTID